MLSINDTAYRAHENSVKHGFWDGQNVGDVTTRLAKLALIVSEVGKAIEAVRIPNGNIGEELADIIIRVFDLSEAIGVNIESEIHMKMAKNKARPMMHGKLA